jgi:hypothetical protein
MANFAVIDDKLIINIIVADSVEIAESVTNKTCVEVLDNRAVIGGTYENGIFIKPSPFPSWVLDSNKDWIAPINIPETDPEEKIKYTWNELTLNWVKNEGE